MSRTIRAPRGTDISCKGWVQEAAMRMLRDFKLCPAKIAELDARTALKLMPKSRTLEREVLARLSRLASDSSTSGLSHDERCRLKRTTQ